MSQHGTNNMSGAFGAATTTTNNGAATGTVFPRSVCIEEFRAGVTACLRSWSALRAAAESGWGGNESLHKAEDLRENIYGIMDFASCPPRHYVDVQDLQDNLADFMELEFSVILEDSSDRQVADILWRMYETCYHGDVSVARQIVASSCAAQSLAAAFPVKVETMEQDDDDDDDDEAESNNQSDDGMDVDQDAVMQSTTPTATPTNNNSNNNVMSLEEYISAPLFGPTRRPKTNSENKPVRQLGQAGPEKVQEIEMDEDGFATVPVRRRNQKSVN